MSDSAPSLLSKHFHPSAVEDAWRERWEKEGRFDSAPRAGRPDFCILLPPPNVTGVLHMGHAFQQTLMDALVRRHRMAGFNTLWQAGVDHAGIATQIVVSRELERRGVNPATLSREEFLRHAWEWKEHSGSAITRQMRRLGTSCDWQRERFTMEPALSRAVTEAFVRLHQQGLVYRGKRMVNWDPVLLTAVSDLEVAAEEEDGVMHHVKYPFADGKNGDMDGVVIATTRPETILVDGAVAVHPDDQRFKSIVGRKVWVPLTDPPRAIEIIADAHVDPEMGSGCVKITAAHDFNDYEVYRRHPDKNIPLLVLLTPDAKMTDAAPPKYRGMDRFDARKAIVADLQAAGYLLRRDPHRYKLPRGDRSGVVVEPMLTDQWFVRMDELARIGLKAAESGGVKFIPGGWRKVYEHWLENIHDWCVSRQLRWGHRIPAWRDEEGAIYVARDEEEARAQAGDGRALTRDPDVLDTWFSSALWPFSTLGWPDCDNAHFRHYFPSTVLVTAFDILFFWVARMVMMSGRFLDSPPFREVYLTALVRDAEGRKMSKSQGNILDPLDLVDGIELDALVEKRTEGLMNPKQAERIARQTRRQFPRGIPPCGADALRFTLASLASHGRDIKFDLERCAGYRNFCNKIWNAARFALGACADFDAKADAKARAEKGKGEGGKGDGWEWESPVDRWIVSRLQRAELAVDSAFSQYRFDMAAQAVYQFLWDEFCDWHVEMAKVRFRTGDARARMESQGVLLRVLEAALRLAHPLIPFVTEELWQRVAPLAGVKAADSIMQARWPVGDSAKIDAEAEGRVMFLMEAVRGARELRGELEIPAGSRPELWVCASGGGDLEWGRDYVLSLSRAGALTLGGGIPDGIPTLATENFAIGWRADGRARGERTQRELGKIQAELARKRAKLALPAFRERAPKEVVDKLRAEAEVLEKRERELRGR